MCYSTCTLNKKENEEILNGAIENFEIEIEERLYQGNGYTVNIPTPELINRIMQKIIESDVIIEKLKLEA